MHLAVTRQYRSNILGQNDLKLFDSGKLTDPPMRKRERERERKKEREKERKKESATHRHRDKQHFIR